MTTLKNKHIIIAVTGGIAAYKVADLVSQLKTQGAKVQVVMTESAKQFVAPATFQALSGYPVRDSLWDDAAEAGMSHIELARWADVILIAPASADTLARLAQGRADDLITTLCLATTAPVVIAPAMNQAMWLKPQTQYNVKQLQKNAMTLWGPAEGAQACGDVGPGRMLEPSELINRLTQLFLPGVLAGKKIMITAGSTQEAIDPVRFISNHSSGKMGYALAEAAARMGAEVILVSGVVHLPTPFKVKRIQVITADDMLTTVMQHIKDIDLFIAAAAVVDYCPEKPNKQKLKKTTDTITLTLKKTPDIVQQVAQLKPRPFVVGFAAETHDVLENARRKLKEKQLDMIIANDVSQQEIGFNSDDNHVWVLSANQAKPGELPTMPKSLLAHQLLTMIADNMS